MFSLEVKDAVASIEIESSLFISATDGDKTVSALIAYATALHNLVPLTKLELELITGSDPPTYNYVLTPVDTNIPKWRQTIAFFPDNTVKLTFNIVAPGWDAVASGILLPLRAFVTNLIPVYDIAKISIEWF